MPDYKNIKNEQHKSLLSIVLTGLGGFLVAGAIYGGGLWGALVVLRYANAIDTIVAYRNCVLLGYIYVLARAYDKQMFGKK